MECMHPTHAPARRIWTTPSVTSRSSMSPPRLECTAGWYPEPAPPVPGDRPLASAPALPSPRSSGSRLRSDCLARTTAPSHLGCKTWTSGQVAPELHLRLCRLCVRRGVITRLGMARVLTRPERMPAPAGRNGVQVADREAFAKRRYRIVDLCPAQVLEAAGVHEHLHAAALEDLVVGAALGIESHAVREPFAPARLNEQSQVQARLLLGLEQLLQLCRRLIRDGNHSEKTSTAILRGAREQVKLREWGLGIGDEKLTRNPALHGP